MSRYKLQKFAAAAKAPNVLQLPFHLKGKWNCDYFKNNQNIILELGCGKGEYTLSLARMYPHKNFIGIDIKNDRLWSGARIALLQNLENAVFVRIRIEEIDDFFTPGEVDEIWITFPDPRPKPCKSQQRLTSDRFLSLYRNILKPGGSIHLKTDVSALFAFTLERIKQHNLTTVFQTDNLYNTPIDNLLLTIQTSFELKHLQAGDTIKYIEFKLD